MIAFLKKLRQAYGDLKLQTKITIVLMIAVTVPVLLVGILFYGRFYNIVISDTIRQEQDASAQTAPLIENNIQNILDAYHQITELDFYKTLFHKPVNAPSQLLLAPAEAREFCQKADSLIDGKTITGIQIYMDFPYDSVSLFQDAQTKDYFVPMSLAHGTYWYGIFQGTGKPELYCPPFYLGEREKNTFGDMAYIASTTFYYQGYAYPAYIALYSSTEQLTEILKDNLTLKGSISYIINDRESIVASSDSSGAGIYYLDYAVIQDSFMASNGFIEREILGQKFYAGFYHIRHPGWFMVTVLPANALIHQGNLLMFQYILVYLGMLILTSIMAHSLAHSVTNRLSSIISQMNQIRHGTPVPMDSPIYHDEVGDLIDTYNYMTRKMEQLMEDQRKSAEELRIAEFNSLQAQINPHFLYNTMDMINWMALQGQTSEISNAVQRLSRFYKLTLSRKNSISTIGDEEEHVSIYLQIQNMRYHNSISFISDIPDELTEYQIPKLTLQPVIENSVLHGILEKDSKSGTIVLTGWMEDQDIVLLISDDGVGIPPEKLTDIISRTETVSGKGTNIAVYNTHRRLQILYGSSYGLSYTSQPGQGTEVQIRIPAIK